MSKMVSMHQRRSENLGWLLLLLLLSFYLMYSVQPLPISKEIEEISPPSTQGKKQEDIDIVSEEKKSWYSDLLYPNPKVDQKKLTPLLRNQLHSLSKGKQLYHIYGNGAIIPQHLEQKNMMRDAAYYQLFVLDKEGIPTPLHLKQWEMVGEISNEQITLMTHWNNKQIFLQYELTSHGLLKTSSFVKGEKEEGYRFHFCFKHSQEKDMEASSSSNALVVANVGDEFLNLPLSSKEESGVAIRLISLSSEVQIGNLSRYDGVVFHFPGGASSSIDTLSVALENKKGEHIQEKGERFKQNFFATSIMGKQDHSISFFQYIGRNDLDAIRATKIKGLENILVFRTKRWISPSKVLNKWITYPFFKAIKSSVKPGKNGWGWVLVILLLALCFQLLKIYFTYRAQILAIKREWLAPQIAIIKKKYAGKEGLQAYDSMSKEETALYNKYHASPYSLSSLLDGLLPLLLMIALRNFWWTEPSFKGVSLGFITDFAEPDFWIQLPWEVKIPFVGSKISLLVLIACGLLYLTNIVKHLQGGDAKANHWAAGIMLLGYLILFNAWPAAMLLGWIFDNSLNLLVKLLLRKCINKEYHIQKAKTYAVKHPEPLTTSKTVSRAFSRLKKRKK